MTRDAAYRIVAVRYGTLASTKSALYLRWDTYGEPDGDESLDYFFYVLEDGDRLVVIDTGFEPGSGIRRGRTCLRAPRDAVQELDIDPRDVSHLIVSHLHYDHIGNLDLFPAATIFVPATERAFWTGEIALRPQFSVHVDEPTVQQLVQLEREGRVVLYDGRSDLVPGVTAITVGGHSPGQQMFSVETGGTPVVLASDAVHLYEELWLQRPFGVVADLVEMYEAYDLLNAVERDTGATIVPGHDPRVCERFDAVAGASSGLAYEIR